MKGKILIVDDEETPRKSLSDILRLEGYQVEAKGDGRSAVIALSEENFDLMLLDLKMPGMDGIQVLEEAVKTSPNTIVVMLTANGSMESAIEALRQGAHDYLLKPAAPNEILTSVASGISKRADSERKKRLLAQVEASIQELKDAEGVEPDQVVSRSVFTLGKEIKVDLERRELWSGNIKVFLTPTEGKLMKVLLVQGYQTTDWEAPEIMRPLVSRLRRKLAQFEGGDEWIVNVRGTGYVFDGR